MSDAVIGRGYLQVVPKMDSGALDSALAGAGRSGSSTFASTFKSGVSARAVAIGNVMSTALVKGAETASRAATEVVKSAFEGYSTYEQLQGGVEKIFDQMDNSRVLYDALDAWKDLNMSANDYLAAINDVGAMFSATMGDEAAYDTARRGMKAISDYSSGTGKNLDVLNEKFAMITRSTGSYQSIADQFSGVLPATSAAFLEQAQATGLLSEEYGKLTEVPIDEYQAALVGMLEQGTEALGLQGNTAAETADTVSGSIAGMQAAWDNFISGLGDEGTDMDRLTADLVESVGAAVDNAIPVLQRIFERIGPALTDTISGVIHDISPEWGDRFDKIADGAGKIAEGFGHLADGLGNVIDQADASGVIDGVADAITNLGDTIANADFGPWFEGLSNILGAVNDFGVFLKDSNLDAAMANGGMYADMFDPSTWHEGDQAVKNFKTDLEALGVSVKEYGKLSDKTMRTVADAYRTNGNDMESALFSAGLKVDETTGKLDKLDKLELGDKTFMVDDNGTVYDENGKVVDLKDGIESIPDKDYTVSDNGTADASRQSVDELTGSIDGVHDKSVTIKADVDGADVVAKLADTIANIRDKTVTIAANIQKSIFGCDAAGGFFQLHAAGGFITDGPTFLGTDANGVGHFAGEAGREWVQLHADGTTSILPIQNRRYLQPYADVLAGMIGGRGVNVVVNLDYKAGDDANKMARDISRRITAYMNMEA